MAKVSAEGTREKVFSNPILRIKGNAIACEDNFIHINNITQVWVGELPKPTIPWLWVVLGALVGLTFLSLPLLNLVGIAILVCIVVYVVTRLNKPKIYGLNIELNSARMYSFTSRDSQFLHKVYEVLQNIAFDGGLVAETLIVNLGNGTIVNDSSNVKVGG